MKRNILVCDDEPLILDLIEGHFENRGYTVTKSVDGSDIRRMVRECDPSIIIMDLNMLMVEGDELMRLLKNNFKTKKIPIVVFSGSVDGPKRASDSGADCFVPKIGISMEELEKVVDRFLLQNPNVN